MVVVYRPLFWAAQANIDQYTVEEKEQADKDLQTWSAYYDQYITAVNPAVSDGGTFFEDGFDNDFYKNPPIQKLGALPSHPCALIKGELGEAEDMMYLMNFCNRHINCKPGVCLKRKGSELVCKTGAPWVTCEKSHFAKDRDKKWKWFPRRNDPYLNNVPTKHYTTWRANSDIQPVIDKWALQKYLCKYVTKNKTHSGNLTDICNGGGIWWWGPGSFTGLHQSVDQIAPAGLYCTGSCTPPATFPSTFLYAKFCRCHDK